MKIDVIITLDQELTDRERLWLRFQHDFELPGRDSVIEVIPAAPEGWLGRLPSQLGVSLEPLNGAEAGLLLASCMEDLFIAERTFLQGVHQESGIVLAGGIDRIGELPNGRNFSSFRVLRDDLASLRELESIPRRR